MNPFALCATVLFCLLVLYLPVYRVYIPILLCLCILSYGNRISIAGFDFTSIRIVLFLSFFRILIKNEFALLKGNRTDKIVLAWAVFAVITNLLLHMNLSNSVFRIVTIIDLTLAYFIFRISFTDITSVTDSIRIFYYLSIPIGISMAFEYVHHYNFFSIFGGVPSYPDFSHGEIRCQGPFGNSILAGTFGATLFPIIISLQRGSKRLASYIFYLSLLSCLSIIYTSSSSGALMALVFSLFGLTLWRFRDYMKTIAWVTLIALVGLEIYMDDHIWFLYARLADIVGGGGWHRSHLIDMAVHHFNRWALLGTTYTADWFPYRLNINSDMVDITNQYLGEGVDGGFVTMTLFIMIIVYSYKNIAWALSFSPQYDMNGQSSFLLWGMGSSLFSHAMSFMAVNYFDQTRIYWFWLIACISSITAFFNVRVHAVKTPEHMTI